MSTPSNSLATPNLDKAMVMAYKNMGPVTKNKKNPLFKSEYADLDNVLATIKGSLSQVGLALIQICRKVNDCAEVETTILHESGEQKSFGVLQIPVKASEKINIAQAYASAFTYARRYSLSGIFALSAENDDDGNTAGKIVNDEEEPAKKMDPEVKKAKMKHDEIVALAMESMAILKLDQSEFGKLKDWLVFCQTKINGSIREFVETRMSQPNGKDEILKAYDQWKGKQNSIQEPKIVEMNG